MSGDPASGVGVLTALAAGIVSFLSPCVLPLVPGYLSAVTGIAAADLEQADWRRVIVPSLLFVSSFSVIFILLGLGATGIGSTLQQHQLLLDKIAAWVIIAMGALFISALFVPQLNREWHVEGLLARAGTGGALGAGAAVGRAGGPRLLAARAAGRRRCVRAGVDTVHRADPRRDPQRRGRFRLGRTRGLPARCLLRRPRDPVPLDLDRLHPHDDRVRRGQAPLPGDHGDRRAHP